jgi:hypothetical protein
VSFSLRIGARCPIRRATRRDTSNKVLELERVVIIVIKAAVRVNFRLVVLPAIRVFGFIDLPFDVAHHLLLQGSKSPVHVQGSLVGLGKRVKLQQLVFGKALGFLNVGIRIASQYRIPKAVTFEVLTLFTRYHELPAFPSMHISEFTQIIARLSAKENGIP